VEEDLDHFLGDIEMLNQSLEEMFRGRQWSISTAAKWVSASLACQVALERIRDLAEDLKA